MKPAPRPIVKPATTPVVQPQPHRAIAPYKRWLAVVAAAAVVVSGTLCGLSWAHIDLPRAITESRCRAGAFMPHSTQVSGAADGAGPGVSFSDESGVPSTAKLTGPNLLSNANVETGGLNPTGWITSSFGTNTPTFAVVPGYQSAHGLQIDISEYTDGDAKWGYPLVPVTPGGYYEFRDRYRSDGQTRAILTLQDAQGNQTFIDLDAAPPAVNWATYSTTFFVAGNTVKAGVYHTLAGSGTLQTDNYSLTAAQPVGFDRPMVSLTFDDGWKSIHDNALPILQHYKMVSTQYVITGYVGEAKDYMTPSDLYDFRAAGHEIGSHTVNHLNLTRQPVKVAQYELAESYKNLATCLGGVQDFAPPYGGHNTATTKLTKTLYKTSRSTDVGFNTADNLSPYQLKVQNVDASTTQQQLQDWLTTAKNNRAWLILVYHQVDASDSPYARKPASLDGDLMLIKASGIAVKTVADAYSATH